MACSGGGYHEHRFQTAVDKNFFCSICQDVLKDPVQCHNEHYFCKACITQHLKNSQTCPVCMEKVTKKTLNKPSRIVTNYLDGLIINCDHSERGCTELIELGRLEAHSRVCKYKPVTCPNEKCAKIMNLPDLEQHTSEVCEYRQVYCEECDENMSVKKYRKHGCVISKDVHAMKASLIQMQDQIKEMSKAQKEMFEAMKNLTVTGSKVKTAKFIASPTLDARPQGNIVVVGGENGAEDCLSSVEMYSLAKRTWRKLAPMQQPRASPTAHFCNGQVMVTGGHNQNYHTRNIEYIHIHEKMKRSCPDEFSPFVYQLPIRCAGHKTAIINHHLWMVGGCNDDNSSCNNDNSSCKWQDSNVIYTMSIKSPYTYEVKCQLPTPLSYHGLEIVNANELLIIGGSPTGFIRDTVDTVLLYNTVTSTLRELHPLPFPMVDITTVKHGEDVIIIGGHNQYGEDLNTVFKYNCKKNECKQLPGMKYKRSECAAVISGNKVFVMGGYNKEQGCLSSVECFDLDDQVWYELPFMNEAKYKIAAILVP